MRLLILLAASLALATACGKKAPLRPPSSDPPAQDPAPSEDDAS